MYNTHQDRLRLKRPHACSIATQHLDFHSVSKDLGECQNFGYARNTSFFKVYISALGKAGRSLVPAGVHLRIMSIPKIADFASVCARVLGFVSEVFFAKTVSTLANLSESISAEGSGLFEYVWHKGRGSGGVVTSLGRGELICSARGICIE